MTLHFSQILFTEGRTFICLVPFTSSIALYVRPAAGVSLSCPDDLQSPQTNAAGSGLYYLPRRRSVRSLLVAIGDAAHREIVWRQLDDHLVTREYPDVVHAHLARDVREHLVAVLELNAEHRVGRGSTTVPSSSMASSRFAKQVSFYGRVVKPQTGSIP